MPIQEYGYWLSIFGIVGMLLTFDPGITFYLPNKIASYNYQKNNIDLGGVITFGFIISFVFSLILCLISISLYSIVHLFNHSDPYLKVLETIFPYVIIYIISQILSQIFISIGNGFRSVYFSGLVILISNFCGIVLTFIFLLLDFGVSSIILSTICRNLLIIIPNIFYLSKIFKKFNLYINLNKTVRKDFLSQILSTNFGSVGSELPKNFIPIFVGIIDPILAVSFKITQAIPEFVKGLVERPFYVMLTPLADLNSSLEGKLKIIKLTQITVIGLILFSIFYFYFFILFNEYFVKLWVGVKFFSGNKLNILIILYLIITLVSKIMVYFAYGLGKFNWLNYRIFFINSLSILTSYIFINRFEVYYVFYVYIVCEVILIMTLIHKYSLLEKVPIRNIIRLFYFSIFMVILFIIYDCFEINSNNIYTKILIFGIFCVSFIFLCYRFFYNTFLQLYKEIKND
jgi:O-antigen/teichoic acid export membrane protein